MLWFVFGNIKPKSSILIVAYFQALPLPGLSLGGSVFRCSRAWFVCPLPSNLCDVQPQISKLTSGPFLGRFGYGFRPFTSGFGPKPVLTVWCHQRGWDSGLAAESFAIDETARCIRSPHPTSVHGLRARSCMVRQFWDTLRF